MIVRELHFNEIFKGDMFAYGADLLIKTMPIKDGKDGAFYNAVSVETGTHYKFNPDTMIYATPRLVSNICRGVDSDTVFYDGFVYILCSDDDGDYLEKVIVNAEYDEPVRLCNITIEYPDVYMVIFESALSGDIYRYDSQRDQWYKSGVTCGYA